MQKNFSLPCVSRHDDIDTVDRDSRGAHNHDGRGNSRSAETLCPESLQLVVLPTTEQKQTFDHCALTMSSPWDHDDRAFFNENIRRLEQQFALAGLLFVNGQNERNRWGDLCAAVKSLPNIGCVRISGCGHSFCAVPLIYTFMTSGFKCPICRFGGNQAVDLSAECPANFACATWECLCVLAHFSRKHDVHLRQVEENTLHSQLQVINNTFSTIYYNMPWVMRFMLYDEAIPDNNCRPFKAIYIRMYVKNVVNVGHAPFFEMLEMNCHPGFLSQPTSFALAKVQVPSNIIKCTIHCLHKNCKFTQIENSGTNRRFRAIL